MTQAIAALDNLVREELPMMIEEAGPVIAPVFAKIKRTAFGVKSQTGLGRGYKVIHLYETGVAGLIESGDPLGPEMSTIVGTQTRLLAQGGKSAGLTIFPTAAESPHMGDIKRELVLHKVVGNFSIPAAWKQADLLNAAQIKKVARDMKAVAKLKAIYEASSFFSHSVSNTAGSGGDTAGAYVTQVLGKVSVIAESNVTSEAEYPVITIDEAYGRISNFRQGMRIDIVKDISGVLQNGANVGDTPAVDGTEVRNYTNSTTKYVFMIISSVDYLGKKITLAPVNSDTGLLPVFTNGYGSATFPGVAGDWLVMAKTSRYNSGSRPQFS